MPIKLGANVTEESFNLVLRDLENYFVSGEHVLFMGNIINLKLGLKFLLVTTERVIGISFPDKQPIKIEIPHSLVKAAGLSDGFIEKNQLMIEDTKGIQSKFGAMKSEDSSFVISLLKKLHGFQINSDFERLRAEKVKSAIRNQSKIAIVGKKPNPKSMGVILDHCHDDEIPRFILSSGGGTGVFVAFHDRCMIIKTGAITSFMAGSLFGGRVSTFHYGEITGIEYNGGWASGVLEILTASYDGSKNKDFWRGTFKSRNADSNDPWTLSNCLPLDRTTYNLAQNHLNGLQRLISESKKPHVTISSPAIESTDLSSQLDRLAGLYSSGVLTDEEFKNAKARVISGSKD